MKFRNAFLITAISATALVAAFCPKPTPSDKESVLLQAINSALTSLHYAPPAMTDDFSKKTYKLYLDRADAGRRFFTQEDIDTVILSLSNVLQFIKQPYDVIARIGEFTFAILLIKMTDEEAFLWSEKVRQKIVSEVIALSRKSFTVTTSIGVAGARRNSTADELLICARMALDKAKERGGNEVIVY